MATTAIPTSTVFTTNYPPPTSTNNANANAPSISQSHHRRIELQSPADFTYLIHNVSRAARAKIDLHLPLEAALRENSTGVDSMRRSVEAGVNAYIEETFRLARQGISVNGIEAESVEWVEEGGPEEYEAYDTRLASRITALHNTLENLNLSLANTRRTAAALAAQNFQSSFLQQSAELEAASQRQHEQILSVQQGESDFNERVLGGFQTGFGGREEEVENTWRRALEGLGQLGKGLLATEEKGRKARQVVEALEGR